jgi:hypothetical protein
MDESLSNTLASIEKRLDDAERFATKKRGMPDEAGRVIVPVIAQDTGEQKLND